MNGARGLWWATMSRCTQLALLVCAILLLNRDAWALDPSLDVSQYAHTAWKVTEGFNTGTIRAIAQTPDGYLWLGTELGLFRFDGVRAIPWQPPAAEPLPGSLVRRLLVSRDGTLWIGTDKGLASWKNGKLNRYPDVPAQRVDALLEDREGTVWVGVETIPTWGLCAIRNGSVQCYGEDGSLGLGVGALLEDRSGNLWAGTGTGLWQWKPGAPKRIPLSGPAAEVHALIEDTNGTLLVATRGGIIRLVDGKVTTYSLSGTGPDFNPFWLLRDRHGGLWIGTIDRGIFHVHQGRMDQFTQPDGLSSDSIDDLFEDREGNVWVCTNNGLDRFRDFTITTIPVKQGLTNAYVESVLTSRDGGVWLGTRNGLYRWDDGRLTLYRKRHTRAPGTVHQIIDSGLPDDFQSSLYQDHRGRIWVLSRDGAAYLESDRFIPVRAMPGGFAHSIAEDRAGDLWISQDQGLFQLLRGTVVEQIPWARLRPRGLALAVAADPLQGGLWLGFSEGGVAYFKDGKVRASYGVADGLGEGRVSAFQLDADGTLWVATEGGLSRVKDGRVATLSNLNGLPCRSTHEVVEDDAHSLWLYMACGLVRIAQPEVEAWVANPKRTVQATILDNSDGVRTAAIAGGLSPRVGRSTDGRIWYLSQGGVFVIDPRRLDQRQFSFNKLRPPVHIERVIADGKTYWQNLSGDASSLRPKLPPLVHDLTIDYTALSLVVPEKVRFRVKLEGQDTDWSEVTDRHAHYTNLAPKDYRFLVKACNNSGVWNEEGAALDFAIAPAYFQTNWFRAICVVVVLALIWLAYRLRIREVEEREKKFREAVESMPALAFVASSENERTFVNKGWVDFTGLTVEQALGSGWHVAIHPDDLESVLDKWRTAVTTGEPLEYEVRLRHRMEGEYRWFHTRVVPLQDNRGRIVKWCGVATDIEDRRRADEKIKRQERELRQVLDLTPLYVAVFGPDRQRLYANRPALDYFGVTLEEWRSISDQLWFYHPDDRECMAKDVYTGTENEVPHEFEARIRRKDGKYRLFLIRDNPVRDEQGRITHWYLSATDIEDRKRAEDERETMRADLARVNRVSMVGELAASIAHEINQPLSGVMSNGSACLRWLARDPPEVEEAREAARRIVGGGQHAGEIIKRVRALAARAATPREKLDLNETIREVLALVGDEARRRGVMIRAQFADDLSPVLGDRVQLQQVVLNLAMNAIEAMSTISERPRELIITTRNTEPGQVQATVEDSGAGLEPNAMDKIFESFYTTKPGGMGMGLSISRSIVQAHGGRLWATVRNGPGAMFHFSLPKCHEEACNAAV